MLQKKSVRKSRADRPRVLDTKRQADQNMRWVDGKWRSQVSADEQLARPNMQLDETVEIGRGLVVQWFKDKNFAQNARFDRKPVKSIKDQKYVAEWQMRWAASFWTFRSIQIIFFVKRAHKARACQHWWPFILIYWYQFKEKEKKKGMDRNNTKFKNIINA